MTLRYFLISGHYRKPLNFTPAELQAANSALDRLRAFARQTEEAAGEGEPDHSAIVLAEQTKRAFTEAMDDDLNISKALGCVFDMVREGNILRANERLLPGGSRLLADQLRDFDRVLGVLRLDRDVAISDSVAELVVERNAARQAGDYTRADAIRQRMADLGYRIEDTSRGSRVIPR